MNVTKNNKIGYHMKNTLDIIDITDVYMHST